MMMTTQKDPFFQFKELDFTHIGHNAVLKGDFCLQGQVRISGTIEGNIILTEQSELTIDTLGLVKGSIQGPQIIIFGTFVGDIKSTGTVLLKAGCYCSGTIIAKSMNIQSGANCNVTANVLQ